MREGSSGVMEAQIGLQSFTSDNRPAHSTNTRGDEGGVVWGRGGSNRPPVIHQRQLSSSLYEHTGR